MTPGQLAVLLEEHARANGERPAAAAAAPSSGYDDPAELLSLSKIPAL